ncbi:molybdopterin dinucleotide binding domain-containing protein, partial [Escherichia coli]
KYQMGVFHNRCALMVNHHHQRRFSQRSIHAGSGSVTMQIVFQPQDGKWRIAPYYHLFGSDELSQRAPVFQSRMPQPYIKLNPADAAKLGVNAGTRVSFSYDGNTVTLPVEIAEGLTAGQVGLPMGMSGIAPVLAGAHLEDLKEAQQ